SAWRSSCAERSGRAAAPRRPCAPAAAAGSSRGAQRAMSQRSDDDEGETLREARARYFASNGFGADGGHGPAWGEGKLGALPFCFPNTAARVRAVRFHDLHHVVTGYATDVVGEAEIAAWEIATGCAGFGAAWLLNLEALGLGLLRAPGPSWRAFLRGRQTRNLYRWHLDEALLAARGADVRARLGLAAAPAPARASDRVAFAAWSLAAALVFGATLALFAAPIGLGLRALL